MNPIPRTQIEIIRSWHPGHRRRHDSPGLRADPGRDVELHKARLAQPMVSATTAIAARMRPMSWTRREASYSTIRASPTVTPGNGTASTAVTTRSPCRRAGARAGSTPARRHRIPAVLTYSRPPWPPCGTRAAGPPVDPHSPGRRERAGSARPRSAFDGACANARNSTPKPTPASSPSMTPWPMDRPAGCDRAIGHAAGAPQQRSRRQRGCAPAPSRDSQRPGARASSAHSTARFTAVTIDSRAHLARHRGRERARRRGRHLLITQLTQPRDHASCRGS